MSGSKAYKALIEKFSGSGKFLSSRKFTSAGRFFSSGKFSCLCAFQQAGKYAGCLKANLTPRFIANILLTLSFFLAFLLLLSPVNVNGQDNTKVETSIAGQNNIIAAADVYYIRSLQKDEVLSFKFTPKETGYYSLYSLGNLGDLGSENIDITVYNPDGSKAGTDSKSGYNGNFSLSLLLSENETYTIDIKEQSNSATGNFKFIISSPVSIEAGKTLFRYTDASQVCYFYFVPEYSGYYAAYSTGATDVDITVYNKDGKKMLTDSDSGQGSNFSLGLYFDAGEKYLIAIAGKGIETEGNYKFTIKSSETMESDITYRKKLEAGQISFFNFKPSITGYYSLFSNGNTDVDVKIYDNQGKIKRSDKNSGELNNFSICMKMNAEEEYRLELIGSNDSVHGDYSLEIASPKDIKANVTYTQQIKAGKCINYLIKPAVDGDYVIYSTGKTDVDAILYYENGNKLKSDIDSGENNNFVINVKLYKNKVYRLAVFGKTSETKGTFSLTAKTIGKPNPPMQVTAKRTGITIKITWKYSGNISFVNSFRVYFKETGTNSKYKLYKNFPASVRSCEIKGLSEKKAYSFYVTAGNIAGESSPSNIPK